MNMLQDPVPDSLLISGTLFLIYTDFRVWIKFEKLVSSDEKKDNEELLNQIFSLIFKEAVPDDREEAVDQILWFYRCGKDLQNKNGANKKEVFSYDFDDGYIAAAFKQQYGIRLNTEEMHWWEFHAYMLALSDDTEFVKILGYRTVDITSKMTSAQKDFYQKMKQYYKLPIKKDLQEQYNQLEEALLNGQSIDGLL